MTSISRKDRVLTAWADAYDRIGAEVDLFCAKHGVPPNCLDMIREYTPTRAQEIEDAEKAAEARSVAWVDGGPGGVQVLIDRWVELWIAALREVALAR
jgi:hypothetical protein